MKKIAILIQSPPHGNSAGREALDCALALSDQHEISVYFIDAGVFHLLDQQNPESILSKNYIKTFNLLDLYDIESVYFSIDDCQKHHLPIDRPFAFAAIALSAHEIKQQLQQQAIILSF